MKRQRPVTEVPDVVGLSATDACAAVRGAGLVPYGPEYAAEPDSGMVTAQRPIGTAGSEEGSPVFLWTRASGDAAHDPVDSDMASAGMR